VGEDRRVGLPDTAREEVDVHLQSIRRWQR
jgi:hypothetical protein